MIENGKLIFSLPTLEETRKKVQAELNTLWDEALRLSNPHKYIINLSPQLSRLKSNLLEEHLN